MNNEFDLIGRYFDWQDQCQAHLAIGVGDDAAVLDVPHGQQLVVTADTLVESVHFPEDTDPYAIAVKALAVNLSDLAAMAATPAWFTLSLTLPEFDEEFLGRFSQGLRDTADLHGIALVGGDTTRGRLTISIQAMGLVPKNKAVLRSGAVVDDDIYVTGDLGAAALGLLIAQGKTSAPDESGYCLSRLNLPVPRLSVGLALQSLASAMIDCSDGFIADLSHLLKASSLGAVIERDALPVSKPVEDVLSKNADNWRLVLGGGDDYELIFTAAPAYRKQVQDIALAKQCQIARVGVLVAEEGVTLLDSEGARVRAPVSGYLHFQGAK